MISETNKPTLAFILSLPRSGSTVLSALLDRKHGIVSPPESSFPQVLGATTPKERNDKRWLAALYIAATYPPTQLNLDEAEACMGGSNEDILINLGRAVAKKLSRDPREVRAIVWKTPRTVAMHDGPLSTGGRFIILRRNPQNVFESQFRVDFGKNNRNPYRFAIFRESYEQGFSRLPSNVAINIEYDDLPESINTIMDYLGVPERGEWESTQSSLDLASESCYWMKEVTKEFRNNDPEKRARLDPNQVRKLELAMKLARPLRSFLGPVRDYFDRKSKDWCDARACRILEGTEPIQRG